METLYTSTEIADLKKQFADNFIYINALKDQPEDTNGSMVAKIDKNPKRVFHFLEYISDCEYVDLDKEAGTIFVDDKVTWNFLFKTEYGYINVYDWKGYSVSISSVNKFGVETSSHLKEKVTLLKDLIEKNIDKIDSFKKTEAKMALEAHPLDNFMNALGSLYMLFNLAKETNKNTGLGYLETLILYVSLLDTMLRYSILLTRINQRMSKTIDADLLDLFYQGGKSYLSERAIFNLAVEEVDFLHHSKQDFFEKAHKLYDERNKAVHRFAITNFQYIEIKEVLEKYIGLESILSDIMMSLEEKQAELGVGFILKENLNLSKEEWEKEMKYIAKTKINPSLITTKIPEREPMFSDKYKGGVNPKLKKVMKKYEKEMSEKFEWKKTDEGKYELKQKKTE